MKPTIPQLQANIRAMEEQQAKTIQAQLLAIIEKQNEGYDKLAKLIKDIQGGTLDPKRIHISDDGVDIMPLEPTDAPAANGAKAAIPAMNRTQRRAAAKAAKAAVPVSAEAAK